MTEFIVRMENRPGRLAALTEAIAAVGVNIEALAAYALDGESVVRLIVNDAAATRRVLSDAALHHEEHTVLTSHLPDRPGELARLTRQLADSGVNIEAMYVLNSTAEGLELAISVDDQETALPHLGVRGSTMMV